MGDQAQLPRQVKLINEESSDEENEVESSLRKPPLSRARGSSRGGISPTSYRAKSPDLSRNPRRISRSRSRVRSTSRSSHYDDVDKRGEGEHFRARSRSLSPWGLRRGQYYQQYDKKELLSASSSAASGDADADKNKRREQEQEQEQKKPEQEQEHGGTNPGSTEGQGQENEGDDDGGKVPLPQMKEKPQ